MKSQRRHAFTIVELLTVIAIIAILVGVLVPSLNLVRNIARETKQKAQLVSIDQALMAFRSDDGDYPESVLSDDGDYCGAQKLAEALLGQDLLGFHPGSYWLSDGSGEDKYGSTIYCYPTDPALLDVSLDERKGPYLELATANAFTLKQLFENADSTGLWEDGFVICDSFSVRKITIGGKPFKAGNPILYYRAYTSSKKMDPADKYGSIYNSDENYPLIVLKKTIDGGDDPLAAPPGDYFYDEGYKIIDPKVTARDWPYRADSYILISAGIDGLYGTSDDITNF